MTLKALIPKFPLGMTLKALTGIKHDNITGQVSKIHAIDIAGFEKEGHEIRNISFLNPKIRSGASIHITRAIDVTISDLSSF